MQGKPNWFLSLTTNMLPRTLLPKEEPLFFIQYAVRYIMICLWHKNIKWLLSIIQLYNTHKKRFLVLCKWNWYNINMWNVFRIHHRKDRTRVSSTLSVKEMKKMNRSKSFEAEIWKTNVQYYKCNSMVNFSPMKLVQLHICMYVYIVICFFFLKKNK